VRTPANSADVASSSSAPEAAAGKRIFSECGAQESGDSQANHDLA
jgi:hypothetical protein